MRTDGTSSKPGDWVEGKWWLPLQSWKPFVRPNSNVRLLMWPLSAAAKLWPELHHEPSSAFGRGLELYIYKHIKRRSKGPPEACKPPYTRQDLIPAPRASSGRRPRRP